MFSMPRHWQQDRRRQNPSRRSSFWKGEGTPIFRLHTWVFFLCQHLWFLKLRFPNPKQAVLHQEEYDDESSMLERGFGFGLSSMNGGIAISNGSPGNALCPEFILQVLLFPRDLDDPGRWQPIGFRCVTTPTTGSYQGRSLIIQVWRGKLRQLRSVGNLHTKNACIASFMKSYSPAEMLGLKRICHCNTRMWHSRFPVLFFQ